ncbi:MAG: hypothetical protein EOO42_02850 [Flavobacteriales bacterium]|nr:MAG: hypothetical protein EOO42_02850 [Flavobacteriales bacterium]
MKRLLVVFFALMVTWGSLNAQLALPLGSKIENYKKAYPIEKNYLSFDKPYYNVGDTIWFKTVLLNGDLSGSIRSDKMHVELFNDSLILLENRVIPLNNGLGFGDFALDFNLKGGNYTIRAYTNWQQNFGNDYFFQKSFYIGKASDKTWLLDSYQKLNTGGAKPALDLKLRITNIKNEAVGLRDVEIYLMDDKKRLAKASFQTDANGLIETSIPLNEYRLSGKYSFRLIDKKDATKNLVLPINLHDIDQVDLQFMPESGYLINDIYGKVAFKALGADGLGKNISGYIVNNKSERLAEFSALHKGMGSFFLLPKSGETYTAIYNINGKSQKTILPLGINEGTALRVDHLSNPDSIYVYAKASPLKRTANYELVALNNEGIVFTVAMDLKAGFSNLKLAKNIFPEGITHFTMFANQQPVNDRQVFINKKQKINLHLDAAKDNYKERDSVSLEVTATKEDGSPLAGNFSVSVTDDKQVKQQTTESNIISYFLLQSDLKGNIEDAGWYFKDQRPETLLALDYLLLTQGWIGYKWDDILRQDLQPKFKPEKGSTIEGRLTNILKKPASNLSLTLMSLGKDILITDTISNLDGRFTFDNLPLLDTVAYAIKIKNKRGKSSSATINVEEFISSKLITEQKSIIPWYINTDTTLLNYYRTSEKRLVQSNNYNAKIRGNMLEEVEIKGISNEVIQNLVWDGKLVEEFPEKELKKMPRKSLWDLMKAKIPNLKISRYFAKECFAGVGMHRYDTIVIGTRLVSAIRVDKVDANEIMGGRMFVGGGENGGYIDFSFQAYNHLLQYFNAEDVKHISVYLGCSGYFIDITTRSGNGPWMNRATGMYVYRPLPNYIGRDFYSPKYKIDQNKAIPDHRATIFWDANVVTDENGKAKISFYAADKPTTYTVKIEGTDLLGRFGYKTTTLKVINSSSSK